MNESVSYVMNQSRSKLGEINNNLALKQKRKNGSQVSVSSASSYQSDSSEDNSSILERKASLQDIIPKAEDKQLLAEYSRKCRSMSDGAAGENTGANDDLYFQAFPSFPNSFLESMGLHGDGTRERLNEEELEQKFTSLALAFAIDGSTVKDRCGRQRRHRDQTEANLTTEIERFKEKLALMQPLCTDIEKAELLSTLLTQIDIIMSATSLVSIAAERYGSVQHEDRLSESVFLMVNHVQMLKQQRDSARRQLQYTKRVLQNSHDSPASSPTNPQKNIILTTVNNKKVICKRRASIATFSEQMPENKPLIEIKKITRRTSDLSLRATSSTRNSRPSRLELGGDLLKISEGLVETQLDYLTKESENESDDEEQNLIEDFANSCPGFQESEPVNWNTLTIREKFEFKFHEMLENAETKYRMWSEDGTIHQILCFCALLCFSLSLLIMVNILIEYEYAKRGFGSSNFFGPLTNGHNKKYSSKGH